MAYGVKPHLGEWIVNLGEAAEYMFDHNVFQENLVGVDYCEGMVRRDRSGGAGKDEARSAARGQHGYKTIGDIMRSLNPFTGEFYREALQVSRMTREMFCLMEGRHVHPSTLYPGGVGTVATIQLMTDYISRLMRYVEFMKKVVPMHDDLFDFFYEALPGYEQVGLRRTLLGCWGSFQDPEHCDFEYRDMADWGRKMFVTPGMVVDGKLVPPAWWRSTWALGSCSAPPSTRTGKTRRCRLGRAPGQPGRPAAPVEPAHQPQAAEARPRRQVQLGDVPRWYRRQGLPGPGHRRRPAGPALGHRARRARRHRLRQVDRSEASDRLPKTALKPPVSLEWKIPQWSNTLERNRARTYFQAYAAACALHFAEKALVEIRAGPNQDVGEVRGARRRHRLWLH